MGNRTGQRRVGAAWVVTLAMVVMAGGPAVAQRGAPANGEWPTYGGDLGGTKYSPLDQIDRTNFGDLEIAWRWLSADAFLSIDTPDGGEWWADSRLIFEELLRRDPNRWRDAQPPYITNLKATPLMVGGRLFINMPTSQAASIDAETGETLWVYNPKTYEEGTTTMTARWNQRGVAYWSDGPEREDERILFGTGNGHLICVDAKTGRPCADFGDNGWVDLTEGIPRAERGSRDWLNALLYSVQSPPLVVGDTVVTPSSISSYNITREAPPGWMRGFDVRTGRMKWMFHTIPQGDEFGNDTWEGDSWRVTGKVGVWSFMSADPELGLLYLPTNTPAPDYYGGHRLGDNLFAESVVALNIETGEREWHFQAVHHGLWDWDFPAAPQPARRDGRRPAGEGTGAGQQAGLPVRLRPGHRRADLADRGARGGDRHQRAGRASVADAAVSDQARAVRVPGGGDSTIWSTSRRRFRQMACRRGPGLPPRPHLHAADVGRDHPAAEPPAAAPTGRGRPSIRRRVSSTCPRNKRLLRDAVPASRSPVRAPRWPVIERRGPDPARGRRCRRDCRFFKPPYSRMTAIDLNTGEHVWMKPMGNGDRSATTACCGTSICRRSGVTAAGPGRS